VDIGIFQILPHPEGLSERDVVEQALWEVDYAESAGFSSVWVTEHHLSRFGLVGAPSVYAAAVAQRTTRLEIGYAVAVVPLHHPLRLAEEIAWVDHLSRGRVLIGVGAGLSPYDFGALGVPFEERRERLEEGLAILRGALGQPGFAFSGAHWKVPPVTLRPGPYRGVAPPVFWGSTSPESLHRAAFWGEPLLLGLKSLSEIAGAIATYRSCRAKLGHPEAAIEASVAEFRVLRRVALSDTDDEATAASRAALAWEGRMEASLHGFPEHHTPPPGDIRGGCIGAPQTVLSGLLALRSLGIRHVIAWMSFGDMPHAMVRRSMAMVEELIPSLAQGG